MIKQQVMELWKNSFNDTEEFIRLYFERVYNDENTLVIQKNGQVVSALQILPYSMSICGTEISVAYISGACTLPQERGKGLMGELLARSFRVMAERNIALAALIPSDKGLFDYYRKHGFIESFSYHERNYRLSENLSDTDSISILSSPDTIPFQHLYAYLDKKLRERPASMLHGYNDFITIQKDLKLSGGKMLTALDERKRPIGMIFAIPAEEDPDKKMPLIIKELLYDNIQIKEKLLHEATILFGRDRATYMDTTMGDPSAPRLGMARIIDKRQLMRQWILAARPQQEEITRRENLDTQELTRTLLNTPEGDAYISLMLD